MELYRFGILCTFLIWITASDAQTCARAKVQNGRTKLRMRGRMAIYRCKRDYTMHGNKVAVCLSGRWSHPPPKCIAAGCPDVVDNTGLMIKSSYDGAMLSFSCPTGYKLQGPTQIFCDKTNWDQQQPACQAMSSKLSCDFERVDLCGWTQATIDDFEWLRFSGATPSGFTGPSFDHTFGRTEKGHYMYVETSAPRKAGDSAALMSPLYLPEQSDQCFQVWFHMLGPDGDNDVGSLEVFVKPEGVDLDTLAPELREEGNKGDEWFMGMAKVPSLATKFQIVIVAQRKESYISDIAIDDVRLYNCSEEVPTENTTITAMSSTTLVSESTEAMITVKSTTPKPPTPKPSTTTKPPTTLNPPTTPKPPTPKSPRTPKPPTPNPTRTPKPPTPIPRTTRKPSTSKSTITPEPLTSRPRTTQKPLATTGLITTRTTKTSTTTKPSTAKPTTQTSRPTKTPKTPKTTTTPRKRTRQTRPATAKPTTTATTTQTTRKDVPATTFSPPASAATGVLKHTTKAFLRTTSTQLVTSPSTYYSSTVYDMSNITSTENANVSTTEEPDHTLEDNPRKSSQEGADGDYLVPMGIGIASGVLFTVIVIAIFAWVWAKKKKRRALEPYDEMEPITKSTSNNSLNLNLVNEYHHM